MLDRAVIDSKKYVAEIKRILEVYSLGSHAFPLSELSRHLLNDTMTFLEKNMELPAIEYALDRLIAQNVLVYSGRSSSGEAVYAPSNIASDVYLEDLRTLGVIAENNEEPRTDTAAQPTVKEVPGASVSCS